MRGILKFRLFSFKINRGIIEIHTLQSDSNKSTYLVLFFFDRSVEQSISRTFEPSNYRYATLEHLQVLAGKGSVIDMQMRNGTVLRMKEPKHRGPVLR